MTYRRINNAIVQLFSACLACSAVGVSVANAEQPKAGTNPGNESAAKRFAVLRKGVRQERLFGLAFEGDHGVAVGDLGQVFWTEDAGATWKLEQAPSDMALLDVAMVGERVIAVGQQGLIVIRDGEGDWRQVESNTTERLLSVDAAPNGLAYAVGSFGTVLRSTDTGETWQAAAPDWEQFSSGATTGFSGASGAPTMNAVQLLGENTVLLAGEISYILRSQDAGENWALVNRAQVTSQEVAPSVNALQVRADGTGYAVGQAGLILKTTDGGTTWARVQTPIDGNLLAVTSTAEGGIISVGMRVAVVSQDEGVHWRILDDLDLDINWYSDIAAGEAGNFIAVGHRARIIRIPNLMHRQGSS